MMKKQFLRRALLTLVGGVILSMSAWGQETFGDTETGWGDAHTSAYPLKSNQSIVFTFTVAEMGTGDYDGYVIDITKTNAIAENNENCYLFWRSSDRAFHIGTKNWWEGASFRNDNLGDTKISALNSGTFVVKIRRADTQIIMTQDIKTSLATNRYYFVQDIGTTEDIYVFLCGDRTKLTVQSVTTSEESYEHVVGLKDCTKEWWQAFSEYYTLNPESTWKLRFKNYSQGFENYHNWALALCNENDRSTSGYTEYLVLRSDHYGWHGNFPDDGTNPYNTDNTSWYTTFDKAHYPAEGWAYFRTLMDGATINMTITRNGKEVKVNAAIEGTEYYEEFIMNIGDGTETLRAFFSVDHSCLDILPATVEVTSTYGWVTFSSDYTLDFTNVTDLEAYTITGFEGNAIKKVKVTGTVPAGTGLLLKADAGTYSIPVATSATAAENCLVAGTGEAVGYVSGKTRYVLGLNSSTDKLEFQKLVYNGAKATVPADKAYLEFDGDVNAPALSFEGDGETTGIANVNVNANANSSWYDLSGRRVVNPTKGLYIVNGKKVIIK